MKEGIMKKKTKSTYEEFIENEEQKALLDKEYKEPLLSELLIAAMEHDHISVRKLASAAGVSPTINYWHLQIKERNNLSVIHQGKCTIFAQESFGLL